LNIYRRLSALIERSELEAMEEEIRDRFGPLPQEVRNLLGIMSIRIILKELGISRLDIGTHSLVLTFEENGSIDPARIVRLASTNPVRFRFLSGDRLKIHTGPLLPQEDFDKIRKNIEMLKGAQLTGGDLDLQRLTG
jgi:transcription-repair coupling factor (superfamily II helicase)